MFYYSYPGCCVTTGRPVVCLSKDSDLITANLINDIHSRMPSLCGERIQFSKKPLAPSTVLHTVPTVLPGSTHPNTRPIVIATPRKSLLLGRPNLPSLKGESSSQMVPNGKEPVAPPLPTPDDALVPSYTPLPGSSKLPTNSSAALLVEGRASSDSDHTIVSKTSSSSNKKMRDMSSNGVAKGKRLAPSSLMKSLPTVKRVCPANGTGNSTARVVPSLGDINEPLPNAVGNSFQVLPINKVCNGLISAKR